MMYQLTKQKLLSGLNLNLITDDIRVALLSPSYEPDLVEDEFWGDISAHECTMAGYTAGGQSLTNITLALLEAGVKFDADDVSWSITGSGAARRAVVYKNTGDSSTSPLLVMKDFYQLRTVINKPFIIKWAAEGILVIP